MRILHLSSEYPPQKVFGLGRFVYDLAGAQAAAGDEVCVITNSLSGDRQDLMERGVRVCRVDWPPPPKPADESATVMQFNVQLFERAVPIINSWKPDVINVHDWLTASAGKALKQLYGIPLVVTIHDTVVGKQFGDLDNEHRFIGRVEHWICRRADRVICCSNWVREELVGGAYKARPEKVDVIPCGVDAGAFEVSGKPEHLAAFRSVLAASNEPMILYVGRLDAEKGLEVAMNALPLVLGRHPTAKFVLAGRGKMEASLREHLAKNKLLERVFFAGYVRPPALAHLYGAADIQIVPSTYEPFGIVALEAMACGKPVVASNTGGLADIVEHGKTGLLYNSGSHEALANCLDGLLADAGRRGAMGAAGRQRAVEVFNWFRVAETTRATYEAACGRGPAPLREKPAPAIPRSGKPRILFDCQQLSERMTGVGYYSERVLGAMLGADEDREWVLLCHSGNARHVGELAEGLPHVRTVVLRTSVPLDYGVQQDMLSRLIPEQGIDLYFSPSFLSVPRELCPSVSAIHDATFEHYPEFHPPGVAGYLHRCVENTCRNAERIVTISENSKADIVRFYGYPAKRIVVTPLAADEDFFRSRSRRETTRVRERYGLPERYVLAVNMGNPKKNVAVLLGAWARMSPALRGAFKLAVVGEWSPAAVDIPRLVKERGIEDEVVVTGFVPLEDLYYIYAGATLFCFPSLHEGFGLPVLEAMASGVPVISSNAASLPEVAADAAVMLDPKDEAGWTAAMERLLSSEKERAKLSKEGRWRANQFKWEQTAEATLGVIDEVLESAARPSQVVAASAAHERLGRGALRAGARVRPDRQAAGGAVPDAGRTGRRIQGHVA